jgi:hypothetical protein
MEFECPDQPCRAERGCLLDFRARLVLVDGRALDDRRETTMGYVGFTIFIAASGALIFWFWHRTYNSRQSAGLGQGRLLKNGLPDEPIPPLKRTVSGQSESEQKEYQLLDRIDAWQKSYEARRHRFNNNVEALKGTKYTYVPRSRSGGPISSSA